MNVWRYNSLHPSKILIALFGNIKNQIHSWTKSAFLPQSQIILMKGLDCKMSFSEECLCGLFQII